MYGAGSSVLGGLAMDALINVVLPVFGIILTGYLAGRFEALGPDSAAALNRTAEWFTCDRRYGDERRRSSLEGHQKRAEYVASEKEAANLG